MALYYDGVQIAAVNFIPRMTLAEYNSLQIKPDYWIRTDSPDSYKKLPAGEVSYDNSTSGLTAIEAQSAIDEITALSSSEHTFNISASNWVANTDSSTSADYPYKYVVTTTYYNAASKPIWQMNGVGVIPIGSELDDISLVIEAVFDTNGVTLYATDAPSGNLVLEVKGL